MAQGESVLKDIELQSSNSYDEQQGLVQDTYTSSDSERLIDTAHSGGAGGSMSRPLPQQITLWKPTRCIIFFDVFVIILALAGLGLGGLSYYKSLHGGGAGTATGDLGDLQHLVATLTESVDALTKRVSTLESTDSKSTLAALSVRVTAQQASIDSLQNNFNSQQSSMSGLQSTLSSLSQQVQAVQDTINSGTGGNGSGGPVLLAGFVSSVQSRLAALQENITSLFIDISENEMVMGDTRGVVDTLSQSLDHVSSELNSIQGDTATASGQIDTLNTNMAAINAAVTNFNTDVEDLHGQLTLASADITSLRHEIENLPPPAVPSTSAGGSIDTTSITADTLTLAQIQVLRMADGLHLQIPRFFSSDYLHSHNGTIFSWIGPPPDVKDAQNCNAGFNGASNNPRFFPNPLYNGAPTSGVYLMGVHLEESYIDLDVQWSGNGVRLNLDGTITANGAGFIAFTARFINSKWILASMTGSVGTQIFECHSSTP